MNEYQQRERMARKAAEERFIADRQRKRSNRVWLMIIVLSGAVCFGAEHLIIRLGEQSGARPGEITLKSEITPTQTN